MDVLTKCYTKDSNLVTRCVAGETIIVPIKNKVGDLGSIYTLNEVGTMIWELIDGKKSVSRIAEAICDAYDVTPEEALKDTFDFLRSAEEAGLIK
ncbi:MAG: PqqD family protein [Thermodesulfobacteriota bacterium]